MSVAFTQPRPLAPVVSLRAHWQIYLADGALLGIFMVSACTFAALLGHPSSPVSQLVSSLILRRILGGIAMGLTAICLIYSPWGKRTGALMNPAMTLSFLRLGRIQIWDAVFYILAQFVVGSFAVALMAFAFSRWIRHPSVDYVATIPGPFGQAAAWLGEFIISALLMTVVMAVNKIPRLAPYTGYFAGALVAIYIAIESPISGMSMNPARTFASAVNAQLWIGWWIYFTAPILGMFTSIELHRIFGSAKKSICGKLNHSSKIACFIRCNCIKHN